LVLDEVDRNNIREIIKDHVKTDSERNEEIIQDYVERGRTLQRNYLIIIGLALIFLLLFSFPYFSVEDALKSVGITQKQL
jgi:hypothetical protein